MAIVATRSGPLEAETMTTGPSRRQIGRNRLILPRDVTKQSEMAAMPRPSFRRQSEGFVKFLQLLSERWGRSRTRCRCEPPKLQREARFSPVP